MKRHLALMLVVAILLAITGCQQTKTENVCPQCSAKVDFSRDSFCSKCGATLSDIGNGESDEMIVTDEPSEPMVEAGKKENELVGAWLAPEADLVMLFNDDYSLEMYFIESNGLEKARGLQYSINGNNINLIIPDGVAVRMYGAIEYVPDDDILVGYGLDDDGSVDYDDVSVVYTRIGSVGNAQTEVFGTWRPVLPNSFRVGSGWFSDLKYIDFYQDGSAKISYLSSSKAHGRYSLIHNGSAIELDLDTDNEVFELEMLKYGIMCLTDERGLTNVFVLDSSSYQ